MSHSESSNGAAQSSDLGVSVVIPAFRAAKTIRRAIDSVVAQTVPACEILVVDDGSPDPAELAAVLEPYGSRVTLIHKSNGGVASARNLGIDRARGAIIAFLDADDYWEPAKLERQVQMFRDHPQIGMIAGRYFTEAPQAAGQSREICDIDYGRVLDRVWISKNDTGPRTFDIASKIWTSTVAIRGQALGERRFNCCFETGEDRDLWVRVAMDTCVYIMSSPLATAVLEPGSLSRKDVDHGYEPMVRVIRQHADLLGGGGQRFFEARIFRAWAAAHLGGGQPRAALRPAWDRLRRQPSSVEGWWVLLKCAALACRPKRLRT
jgi:cellulose synthase/poly-beta-1,6-N-acetylglucosamine synthase-like glycosyltransferase